jgi:predicted nucleic acid-binding protein
VKKCLLDTSFLIDLLNELADRTPGPALEWLRRNAQSRLWITPVSLAEILEAAQDPLAVRNYLGRYSWQGIHRGHAEQVALLQRRSARRMGENDAWQAAIAQSMGAILVGHDNAAFRRLGADYDDHRR